MYAKGVNFFTGTCDVIEMMIVEMGWERAYLDAIESACPDFIKDAENRAAVKAAGG
jgi:hypothetical protein